MASRYYVYCTSDECMTERDLIQKITPRPSIKGYDLVCVVCGKEYNEKIIDRLEQEDMYKLYKGAEKGGLLEGGRLPSFGYQWVFKKDKEDI